MLLSSLSGLVIGSINVPTDSKIVKLNSKVDLSHLHIVHLHSYRILSITIHLVLPKMSFSQSLFDIRTPFRSSLMAWYQPFKLSPNINEGTQRFIRENVYSCSSSSSFLVTFSEQNRGFFFETII